MTAPARTVALKAGSGGRLSLAHPLARAGRVSPTVYTLHVLDVPADVQPRDVLMRARGSMTAARAARTGYRVAWADVAGPRDVRDMPHAQREADFDAAMADGDFDAAEVLACAPVPATWTDAERALWGVRRKLVRTLRFGAPS